MTSDEMRTALDDIGADHTHIPATIEQILCGMLCDQIEHQDLDQKAYAGTDIGDVLDVRAKVRELPLYKYRSSDTADDLRAMLAGG